MRFKPGDIVFVGETSSKAKIIRLAKSMTLRLISLTLFAMFMVCFAIVGIYSRSPLAHIAGIYGVCLAGVIVAGMFIVRHEGIARIERLLNKERGDEH